MFSQIALPYKLHQLGDETFFKNIKQIKPGQIINLNLLTGIIQKKLFWTISKIYEKNKLVMFKKTDQ